MTYNDLLKILNHRDANESSVRFRGDCERIQAIVQERYDVSISLQECEVLWRQFSAEMDAQWLNPTSFTAQEICEATVKWAKSFSLRGEP